MPTLLDVAPATWTFPEEGSRSVKETKLGGVYFHEKVTGSPQAGVWVVLNACIKG